MPYSIAGKTFENKEEAENFYLDVAECACRSALLRTPISGDKVRPQKDGKEIARLVDSYEIQKVEDGPTYCLINYCPYAVFVHELIFNYHKVGQAKFLEDAGWDVQTQFNVKASIDIKPVKFSSGTTDSITLYFDHGEKGYDLTERRRNAQVLFARYYKWRCEIREKKIKEILDGANKSAGKLAKLEDLRGRNAYEEYLYKNIMPVMESWKKSTGKLTYNVPEMDRFAVPLSKIYKPFPYSQSVIDFGKKFEDVMMQVDLSKITYSNVISITSGIDTDALMKQFNKDINEFLDHLGKQVKNFGSDVNINIDRSDNTKVSEKIEQSIKLFGELIKQENKETEDIYQSIMHQISLGNEDIIGKIENIELLENGTSSDNFDIEAIIDDMISNYKIDIDYFDLDTGRFIEGTMKKPKYGRLKIKTFHSGKTINRWEDVE